MIEVMDRELHCSNGRRVCRGGVEIYRFDALMSGQSEREKGRTSGPGCGRGAFISIRSRLMDFVYGAIVGGAVIEDVVVRESKSFWA